MKNPQEIVHHYTNVFREESGLAGFSLERLRTQSLFLGIWPQALPTSLLLESIRKVECETSLLSLSSHHLAIGRKEGV